jgi:hypothetical protein
MKEIHLNNLDCYSCVDEKHKEACIDGEIYDLCDEMDAEAVLYYDDNSHSRKAIDMFLKAGCTTNIHYVLGNNSIDEAIERLENQDFPKGINAVIFLLHKPVGQGSLENVLQVGDERLDRFFSIVDSWNGNFKIGPPLAMKTFRE